MAMMLWGRAARRRLAGLALWTLVAGLGPAAWTVKTAGAAGSGGAFIPVTPARVMDTRLNQGAPGPVPAGQLATLTVAGQDGVPPMGTNGPAAVVLNITVTQPQASGYVTVYPHQAPRPPTSNLNFGPGQTVANLVVASLSPAGQVDIYNGAPGPIQLIADVTG